MNPATDSSTKTFLLSIARPDASTLEHPLEPGRSVFIGSGDSCGIQVSGDKVAKIHCLVEVEEDRVYVQDWASDVGTKVNGTLVEEKTLLESSDVIQIGALNITLRASEPIVRYQPPAKAEHLREESVGMEALGIDDADEIDVDSSEPSDTPVPTSLFHQLSNQPVLASAVVEDEAAYDEAALGEFDEAYDEVNAELEESPEEQLDTTPRDTAEPIAAEFTGFDEQPAGQVDEPLQLPAATDFDWDPSSLDDDIVDPEIVQLMKSEIEDLRIQLAERDEHLADLAGLPSDSSELSAESSTSDPDFGDSNLVNRVDELLAELSEHDERVETLQELLESSEIQIQAEREERNCLESWLGEIEQRIGQREQEWQAEQDALKERLAASTEERNEMQAKLHSAAQRIGGDAEREVVPDETLMALQQQNTDLQSELDDLRKQTGSMARKIERLKTEDPDTLQAERAELAKEKADVSRLRFQLSKQLQDIGSVPIAKDQPDREFAYKLQTLREHLKEIHEEEKVQREQKPDSIMGRISSLWKRVDDEY